MEKVLILLGSSRSHGDTYKMVEHIQGKIGIDYIDLNDYNIGYFDYEFRNKDDDFKELIENIANNYELLIFATPVYWYSMSAVMKTFFDRISDCLKIYKPIGRKLRGKKMGVISCASEPVLVDGFLMPFQQSANYLGMKYIGDVHTHVIDNAIPPTVSQKLDDFADLIRSEVNT